MRSRRKPRVDPIRGVLAHATGAKSMLVALAAAGLAAAQAAGAERPPMPATSTDASACRWGWISGGGLGLWSEACAFATGVWRVAYRDDPPAFVLLHDDAPIQAVVQPFRKAADAPIDAILPELRAGGSIPDDAECGFEPAAIRPPARTIAFFEIRPRGARLAAFEATPEDEVPDPPCGAFGWSTHGVRYFVSDLRHPETIVYVDVGEDGTFIDPTTITFD